MMLSVKVKPNSRVTGILRENEQIVVRIHAPAQEGKANKALVEYLSEVFDIPKSCIEIVGGLTSQFKRIAIKDEFKRRVEEKLEKIEISNR